MQTSASLALAAAALTALLACSPPAAAQAVAPASAPAGNGARSPMSLRQMVEHVVTLGYHDVKEVERKSDKLFEVKARDRQGVWVELYVDARSGEILKSERDR